VSRFTFYSHPKCSTCEKARVWLQRNGVAFDEKDIRVTPPGIAELRTALAAQGGALSRISNTSGMEYRAQGVSAKLAAADEAGALRLLASNGMFIKRPLLIGPDVALAGFKEPAWAAALRPQ
jgi:arsenate reductase